jgi:hypothetical protein
LYSQYGEPNIRRAVPLGLGLLNISNPRVTVMDTLSKLTHDVDAETAQSAIFALGLIGAGTSENTVLWVLSGLINTLGHVTVCGMIGAGVVSCSNRHTPAARATVPCLTQPMSCCGEWSFGFAV